MPVEIALNTPLADALNAAIQPKVVEVGWGSGGAEEALSEYIILMLVNGKTEDEIASELSGDLLNLGPDDPVARDFSRWLFGQIEILNAQLNPGGAQASAAGDVAGALQDDSTMGGDVDTDMNMATESPAGINAYVARMRNLPTRSETLTRGRPTGPRSMRDGNIRGGRERRMMGQINRALEKPHDSILHRVRGQTGGGRINTHTRTLPTGPRMGVHQPRAVANGRAASIAAGLAGGMSGLPAGPAAMNSGMNSMNNGWMMPGPPQPPQMDIFAMLEQQSRMMQQMQEQMIRQSEMGQRGGNAQRRDKPRFERGGQRPPGNFRNGPQERNGHAQHVQHAGQSEGKEGEDVEMTPAKREPPNPEETVCKFNLTCQNKDCKFAHQSPAAPPGTTVDVKDVCGFGAACKNRKCVGRHPSPAARVAHQSEMDCKFYPNCHNPRCPFRHPDMPPCRNGGDCSVPNCRFTHVKTPCKFHPCTNRFCAFRHEEGQRGTFQDKVWVADGTKDDSQAHVSERKFVDDQAVEDVVLPGGENDMNAEPTGAQEVVG